MNFIYERQILHIDMNAFFASCEQVKNPELRKAPLIVGGDPQRRSGIVLAASYDAKKCGVKTTMPLYEAAKLCPNAVFIKPSHGLYDKMSRQVMEIFDAYTPLKEQLSIDEAFLDMTGTEKLFGDSLTVAMTIQNRILRELDLPCSVGISSNKLLAKMASDFKKPMGITTIYPHEVQSKLWPLKVGTLYGVGKKTVVKLNEIGVRTIGDLAQLKMDTLISYFGEKGAWMLNNHAHGRDEGEVDPGEDYEVKSVGNELTYPKDIDNLKDIHRELLLLSDKVGFRLRKKELKGKTISIKVKYADFTVITRSKTLDVYTDSTDRIYAISKELMNNHVVLKPLRLLGVTVSNFDHEEMVQMNLFHEEELTSKLDGMVDAIRIKHGYGAVNRASIIAKQGEKL
ncbi:MAG: DNA polymerase IV [Vallitaleaceae bacterium]|nr:DNA polymerase IV [Vallitaleaceae bacterium]